MNNPALKVDQTKGTGYRFCFVAKVTVAPTNNKDLRLALEAGHALGVPLPVTAVVREMYNALQVAGKGDRDHSAIILLLEDLAKVQVRMKSS